MSDKIIMITWGEGPSQGRFIGQDLAGGKVSRIEWDLISSESSFSDFDIYILKAGTETKAEEIIQTNVVIQYET